MATSSPSHESPSDHIASDSPATPPRQADDPSFREAPRARPTVMNMLVGVRRTWSAVLRAEYKAKPKVIQCMDIAPGVAAKRAQEQGKVGGLSKPAAVGLLIMMLGLTAFIFWKAINIG